MDTHVLLWALCAPKKLSPRVAALLADPSVEVLVSAVSAWEIVIKETLGKLVLPGIAPAWLPRAVAEIGFEWLDVGLDDALRVGGLPHHHRDPLDRLLLAQALGRRLPLVSGDQAVGRCRDRRVVDVIG